MSKSEEKIELPKDFRPSDYGIHNDDGFEDTEIVDGEIDSEYQNTPLIPSEDIPEPEERDPEY